MLHCQKAGGVTDREAYRTWNMGQGMIIVSPDPDEVMAVAKTFGIEAKVIGNIVDKPGIRIASKGYNARKETWLEF